MSEPTVKELRDEAIEKANRAIKAAADIYAKERDLEDQEFDAAYNKARDELERLGARPRPTHTLAKNKRDQAQAEAEAFLDQDIKRIYLANHIPDSKHNPNNE